MFISHKNNVLQVVHETEWNCRRKVKGLDKSEYWTWLDSVTSGDPPVVDYSGETGYTLVECTDEDVQARLSQLGDYQAEGVYNITVTIQNNMFNHILKVMILQKHHDYLQKNGQE